ncbi:MAG: hypothetical protein J5654_11215 [Victivallales bacterium]|nr:hypothetical protein [Victivallales bacterium]
MDYAQLQTALRQAEDSYLLMKSRREAAVKRLSELEAARDKAVHDIDICAKAVEFVEQVATDERRGVKARVEALVSDCLKAVFDDSYAVEFDYGMKRARTSVEVYAIRRCEDGMVVRRQIDGIGGGLADAISLPLKLMVLLNDPVLDRVLVVDEPGKHLSAEHVPKFAQFLQAIAHRLGVQIIMSSHHTNMDAYADSVNAVALAGSQSEISRVK